MRVPEGQGDRPQPPELPESAFGVRENPVSCCAVIVTWQPEMERLGKLLAQLLAQGCAVVIIDNGSSNSGQLRTLADTGNPGVTVIAWPDNRGLAAGLNAGIGWAMQRGCRLALLFDQDSAISGDFCHGMLQAWRRASQLPGRVAAIGPRLQDPRSRRMTPFRRFRCWRRSDVAAAAAALYHADFLITSGTLLSLEAYVQIGPMREDYFIDNIDLEWCFRAVAAGFRLYGTDLAILQHQIGETSKNPLVRKGLVVHHRPLRSYYATRNRLHLWRQSYAPLDWKIRDALRLLLKTAWLLMFCAPRREYWRQTLRGIRDARSMR